MTITARQVLEDCRGALEEMTDGVQGAVWRRRWITAVALLRVVGNALEKVDSRRSPELATVIKEEFEQLKSTKPEPLIYWGFIYEFRNLMLKEYRIGAGQGVTVHLGSTPRATYSYPITDGPFAGRDQRDVIREAIRWWSEHLDRIDERIRERK